MIMQGIIIAFRWWVYRCSLYSPLKLSLCLKKFEETKNNLKKIPERGEIERISGEESLKEKLIFEKISLSGFG